MAPNPAFPIVPAPDPEDTADLQAASVIVANAVGLIETLSALVPLPPPTVIKPSMLFPGAVQLHWVTPEQNWRERGEHEMVAHVGKKPVAIMAFDMGRTFSVSVDSDGPTHLALPPSRLGDLNRFRSDRPWSTDDEDTFAEDVERAAKVAAGEMAGMAGTPPAGLSGCPAGAEGPDHCPACDPPCDPPCSPTCVAHAVDGIGTCCRRAGQAHQEHGDWPMAAPAKPSTIEYAGTIRMSDADHAVRFRRIEDGFGGSYFMSVGAPAPLTGQPIAGTPVVAPRVVATRDQLFAATLPRARANVKAVVPGLLWVLLKPFIEALLAAFFQSLFEAKAEFAARGVGIAIEGDA